MARPRGHTLERQRVEAAEKRAIEARTVRRRSIRARVLGGVAVAGALAALVMADPPSPGVAFPSLGNAHLSSANEAHAGYNSQPASSGPHIGSLASWGDAGQVIPPEIYVHNLEDGGVVLAYSCGDCALADRLREVLADHQGRRLLLTPVDPITDDSGGGRLGAAVAWNRVFYFDDLGTDQRADLDAFIRIYEGVDHHVRAGGLGHN